MTGYGPAECTVCDCGHYDAVEEEEERQARPAGEDVRCGWDG